MPVAIVTGGASGVGKAICARIARQGGKAIALDLTEQPRSGAPVSIGCDVTSRASWRAAASAIRDIGEPLQFVALNAGVMTRPPSAPITDDAFAWIENGAYERVMRVNVDGVVYGLEALTPLMTAGGAIVVTSSAAGLTPLPFDPFYAASKHAVIGLVRSVAPALSARNIRINAFCPGGIATPLVPSQIVAAAPPMMSADEAASAILEIADKPDTGEVFVKAGPGVPLVRQTPPEMKLG